MFIILPSIHRTSYSPQSPYIRESSSSIQVADHVVKQHSLSTPLSLVKGNSLVAFQNERRRRLPTRAHRQGGRLVPGGRLSYRPYGRSRAAFSHRVDPPDPEPNQASDWRHWRWNLKLMVLLRESYPGGVKFAIGFTTGYTEGM